MDFLIDLGGPLAAVLVFAFAAAEGGLLVGLFLPGEAPLLIAGVLAFQGRVSLVVILVAACLGAVVGDSLGYWLGRRYGRRLETTKLGSKIGEARWDKVRNYLQERGGKAVFLGRFLSIFRTLAPPVAGSAGMPYRRFVTFNAPAAIAFAGGLVLAGYLAGGSWHVVENYVGQASLVLLVLVGVVALFVFTARRVAGNYGRVRARLDAFLERPRVRVWRERYDKQIAFMTRRFDPGARFGLEMTIGIGIILVIGYAFGSVLEDVIESETGFFDRPILDWLAAHRSPGLNDAMRITTAFGGALVALAVMTAAIVVAYVTTRNLMMPGFLSFCLIGALGLSPLIKVMVGRPRPDFSQIVDAGGLAFPSGHATTSAIVGAGLAFALTRGGSWRSAVWIWTAAGLVSFFIGFSRLYLGVHWPTDVIGGWMLGLAWVAIGAVLANLAWGPMASAGAREHPTDAPDGTVTNTQ
jgi:membrane protein DedA with SNARE-associated domain/membrane-associated phospholipid phosphatase